MSRRIRVAPGARAQIQAASDWWFENRPAAPSAFDDDLAEALELIRTAPGVGQPVRHSLYADVRRITLDRVRYHVYYRVLEDSIEVLAVWHTARGSGPDLSSP